MNERDPSSIFLILAFKMLLTFIKLLDSTNLKDPPSNIDRKGTESKVMEL